MHVTTILGLYYDKQEIIPFLCGDYRFNKAGDKVIKFTSLEVEVRALIEGQFIAKRAFAEDIGFNLGNIILLFPFVKVNSYQCL